MALSLVARAMEAVMGTFFKRKRSEDEEEEQAAPRPLHGSTHDSALKFKQAARKRVLHLRVSPEQQEAKPASGARLVSPKQPQPAAQSPSTQSLAFQQAHVARVVDTSDDEEEEEEQEYTPRQGRRKQPVEEVHRRNLDKFKQAAEGIGLPCDDAHCSVELRPRKDSTFRTAHFIYTHEGVPRSDINMRNLLIRVKKLVDPEFKPSSSSVTTPNKRRRYA